MRNTLVVLIGIVIAAAMPSAQIGQRGSKRIRSSPRARRHHWDQRQRTDRDSCPGLGEESAGPVTTCTFANHMGEFIRLAYADAITGPWKICGRACCTCATPGHVPARPDPKETLEDFYTHVASPEILIDHERKQFVMWFHGWWTNGENWPADPAAARAWAQKKAIRSSRNRRRRSTAFEFQTKPSITKTPYIRVFQHDGYYYGVSRLGRLSRSKDPLASFELGPDPFRDGPHAGRIRHVALVKRGHALQVFYTAIGIRPSV